LVEIEHRGATLHAEITDLMPPWRKPVETIVFCHGIATNADVWLAWLPALVADYRIVRFDLRGFGRSQTTIRPEDWSIELLADDLAAVARAAGDERVHLVGESAGGTVALALALKAPDLVRSVTASNASHKGGSIALVQGWRDEIAAHGIGVWSDRIMQARFTDDVLDDARRDWFATVQAASDPVSVLSLADALIAADLSDALSDLAVPALLLCPGESPFVAPELMRDMAARIPNATLRVFPGVRHGLPFSHAEDCAAELAKFLKNLG
jgi:pimeloyl-ACP methyl ester carboxylesterase